MATIKEDFISFETAKLLKEKGFDIKCDKCYAYFADDDIRFLNLKYPKSTQLLSENRYPCITLQMAMKWLREVHNIGIFPSTYTITNSKGSKEEHVYGSAIVNLITFDLMCDDIMPNNSYEQAAEAAIKYCLENLI